MTYQFTPPRYFQGQTVEYIYHNEGKTTTGVVEEVRTNYACGNRAYHTYSIIATGRKNRQQVQEHRIVKAIA